MRSAYQILFDKIRSGRLNLGKIGGWGWGGGGEWVQWWACVNTFQGKFRDDLDAATNISFLYFSDGYRR